MVKWFKSLPWYVQIIILIIILYVLYQIFLFIKRKLQSGNYNAAVSQSQYALNQLSTQGVHPSYGQAQYTSMANSLEKTFTGCGIDWTGVIVPTFKQMKNDADIYALIKNYGVRTFDECGWGTFNGDLAAALTYKLGSSTLDFNPSDLFVDKSVSALNKILKENGLTFAF